jgi:hypothetical protein
MVCTASSRVLLNGVVGARILHGRGLRQGDPLALLLFILAIDPLQKILELATEHGLLHKIRGRGTIIRKSLYIGDAAVFVDPDGCEKQPSLSMFKSDISHVINKIYFSTCH